MKLDGESPCICHEGAERGMTRSTAESFGFCRGCPQYKLCHVDEVKECLVWWQGLVRLHFKWTKFDCLAYTKEQAIKLLRDEIGYHIRLSDKDFKIKYIRSCTKKETALHGCKIKVYV